MATEKDKARRRAVLGRKCASCERKDDETGWSNRQDLCGGCERRKTKNGQCPNCRVPYFKATLGTCVACGASGARPSPEARQAVYVANGGFERFHMEREEQVDTGVLRLQDASRSASAFVRPR
jgi:hypothetical protein